MVEENIHIVFTENNDRNVRSPSFLDLKLVRYDNGEEDEANSNKATAQSRS